MDDLDAALAEYDYTYDLAGQITQWLHHGETVDFTHDEAGQLTGADYTTQTDEDYVYDGTGNRTGGGMVIGDNNQVESDGTYDYEYDAEGNLVLKTKIATGECTEYAYDHRNRMTSAKTYSSGDVLLQEVEFTYDLFNRRIAKTVDADGAGGNPAETIYTVYDGEHAWADFDDTANVTARYLFGDSIDEILARWQPADGTAWYLTDHLGTVRDIVDDAGVLINTITYDSFGSILSQTNASAGDRFTYTGREYDAEIDLYYYRARYYDAGLGRFVSQDPIGFDAGDANLYCYVENNPIIYVDPSGLYSLGARVAIGGTSGWAAGTASGFAAGGVMAGPPGAAAGATAGGIAGGIAGMISGAFMSSKATFGDIAANGLASGLAAGFGSGVAAGVGVNWGVGVGGANGAAGARGTAAASTAPGGATSRALLSSADSAAELAAQRSLTQLQGQIQGGHFLTRHSPLVSRSELYRRATQGIAPEGAQSYTTNATRFLRHSDIQQAIDKAVHAYQAGGYSGGRRIPIDVGRTIGEGFYKETGVLGTTTRVIVGINRYGQPYTAFPVLP